MSARSDVAATSRLAAAAGTALMVAVCSGCGGNDSAKSDDTTTPTSLADGYRQAKWQTGVTVSFSGDCTMTYTSTGAPSHGQAAYYLVPVALGGGSQDDVVATTPHGGLELGVSQLPVSTTSQTYILDICPAAATNTTATSGGATGWMVSGAAMFNAYEGDMTTVATNDNVSYSFVDTKGVSQTASFLDTCSGHQAPNNQYHYHGWSSCLSEEAGDTDAGPSHLVGVALDGYPIYGDRDINGQQVAVTALDECNGITSPTPEFPSGVYHYVLPQGSLTAQAAPRCYRGTAPTQLAMQVALTTGICSTPRQKVLAQVGRQPSMPVASTATALRTRLLAAAVDPA